MCAIPQLVSAPLNPIPIVEHFRRSHPLSEHSMAHSLRYHKGISGMISSSVTQCRAIVLTKTVQLVQSRREERVPKSARFSMGINEATY